MDGRWWETALLVEARAQPRTQDRGHRRAAAAVAAVLLMIGGLFVTSLVSGDRSVASGLPDRPADAQDTPIGTAPTVRTGSDEYAFQTKQEKSSAPVTYDPCAPIHLVVRPRTIVDRGVKLLEEALDEVSDATGLVFVVDGVTDQPADKDAGLVGTDGTWRPVTVEWSDPGAAEMLAGGIAGYAGSTWTQHDDHRWYVTGTVVLDGPQLAAILQEPGGWASTRAVVMHELGHLVGLDHVDLPGQLMQPEGDSSLTTWGDGDRAGLAALGRGRCIDY